MTGPLAQLPIVRWLLVPWPIVVLIVTSNVRDDSRIIILNSYRDKSPRGIITQNEIILHVWYHMVTMVLLQQKTNKRQNMNHHKEKVEGRQLTTRYCIHPKMSFTFFHTSCSMIISGKFDAYRMLACVHVFVLCVHLSSITCTKNSWNYT